MRITNRMMVNNYNLNLSRNLEKLDMYQRQISSMKRISKPSDDPVGVISALRYRTKITETDQYISNISDATEWLDSTDSAMTELTKMMHRVRELGLTGVNGTQSQESKNAIAAEIRSLLEHAQTIANTTFGDKYIFSGTNYTEIAYNNRCWYGNDNSVYMEIGTGVTIDINSKMREFFLGNNYYDVIHNLMPAGTYSAKMTGINGTGGYNWIDNSAPNTWYVRNTSSEGISAFDTGALAIVSSLSGAGGDHNIGASVSAEVSEITYSGGAVSGVKLNVAYRQHDSIGGGTFVENTTVTLQDLGGGQFGVASLMLGKGQVEVSNLIVDTTDLNFKLGAKMIAENTPEASGNPTNLGSISTVQATIQANTNNGSGLVAADPVAAAAYNNLNGSFVFEVIAVDAANQRVQVKARGQMADKFTGEYKYLDFSAPVWLTADGTTSNFVDLCEMSLKEAYRDIEDFAVPDGHQPQEYYDYNTMFQFSQLILEDVNRFSVGDKFMIQTIPPIKPLSVQGSRDQMITVEGCGNTKQWVFSQEVIDNNTSVATNAFYIGDEGKVHKASLDIPLAGLKDSAQIINWETNSTYMGGITGEGLPNNYEYEILTETGLSPASNASIQQISGYQSPVTGLPTVAPDLQYNGDIFMEVIDKVGSNITMKVTSHQVGKDGNYQTFTTDVVLKANGATNSVSIGDITIDDVVLNNADIISIGDNVVFHASAMVSSGDNRVTLTGTHSTDSSRDFSRDIVLNSDVTFPRSLNLSFIHLNSDNGDWESASLQLQMRGIANNEQASFETGINFDTKNTGIFHIMRNMATLLELEVEETDASNIDTDLLDRSVYQMLSQRIEELDLQFDFLINSQSGVGARVNRLEMQQNRLINISASYTEMLSNVEVPDLAELIMNLKAQENVYRASLSVGAQILPPTLVDFLD